MDLDCRAQDDLMGVGEMPNWLLNTLIAIAASVAILTGTMLTVEFMEW